MDNSYMKRRIRLQKNISYYRRLGLDVSWFKLPEMPKGKIGKRAEKALDKAIAQWEYYKGKPLTEKTRKLVGDISKSGGRSIESQIEQRKEKLKKIKIDPPKAPQPPKIGWEPGPEWDDWGDDTLPPSPDENLAIILYNIASDAWQEAMEYIYEGTPVGYKKAPPEEVKARAEHVMGAYTDMGMMDDELRKEFSRKLLESGKFQEIARDLEQGLWDSDSEAYKDPLDRSIGIMQMKDPELSEAQRMHAGNID